MAVGLFHSVSRKVLKESEELGAAGLVLELRAFLEVGLLSPKGGTENQPQARDCLPAGQGVRPSGSRVDRLLFLGALWGPVSQPHHLLPKPYRVPSPAQKPRQKAPAYLLDLLPFQPWRP